MSDSSPAFTISSQALAQGALDRSAKREDLCAEVAPWSRLRFLGNMTQLVKRMVSDVGTFSVPEDLNAPCVTAGSIDIGPKFTIKSNPTHAIYLDLGRLAFEPVGLGAEYALNSDNSRSSIRVIVRGTLVLTCESPHLELSMQMADVLHTVLMATRNSWKNTMSLHSFDVKGGTGGATRSEQEPNKRFSQALECAFAGMFQLEMLTESLPVGRVNLTTVPSAP